MDRHKDMSPSNRHSPMHLNEVIRDLEAIRHMLHFIYVDACRYRVGKWVQGACNEITSALRELKRVNDGNPAP